MVDWIREAILWHVYPLGFLGAEKQALHHDVEPIARLRQMEPWLDYLLEIGCNGILLAPIFQSESHGYDTSDFYNIDSRLGTNADLVWFIELCREKNIKVVLDGVFNHVGRSFGALVDVLQHRSSSRYASWFLIDWNNSNNDDGFSYANFEGHHRLVKLNHHNPEVADYIVNVMTHWLQFGINGWRLDAAYSVPAFFWQQTLDRVRMRYPDAWFLGEVIHGDYSHAVRQGHLESVTQYELWKAIWSALNDRNFFELSHALNRNNEFNSVFLPNTFLGNHDVTRIATELRNGGDLELAFTVLFTIPGVPSIYYGDEQAWQGRKEKRHGGDDAIRPAFPRHPNDLNGDQNFFTTYRKLASVRRENAWLANSRVKVLHLSNLSFVYESRTDDKRLVVALNISDAHFDVPQSHNMELLLHNRARVSSGGVTIDPHGWVILR